jgi:hypothetical protein
VYRSDNPTRRTLNHNIQHIPLGLAEIDGYKSSDSETSTNQPEPTIDWEAERAALAVRLAEERTRPVSTEEARLQRERAARMKIHVETRFVWLTV